MTRSILPAGLLLIGILSILFGCSDGKNGGTAAPYQPVTVEQPPVSEVVEQVPPVSFLISGPDAQDTRLLYINIQKDKSKVINDIYVKAFRYALSQYVDEYNLSGRKNKISIDSADIELLLKGEFALSIPFDAIINAAQSGKLKVFASGEIPYGFILNTGEEVNNELNIKTQALQRAISECPDTTVAAEIRSGGIVVKADNETEFATVNILLEALNAAGLNKFTIMTTLERASDEE